MPKIYMAFPEGKHKVLTMSYDDGREFDRRLISIFNHYRIKGTFHLNSGLLGEGTGSPGKKRQSYTWDMKFPLIQLRTLR